MFDNLYPDSLIKDLEKVLHENANEKIETRTMFQNIYIESETLETELMLRFVKPYNKIVIARVGFKHQQQGSLKKVLKVLEDFLLQDTTYGYTELEFESVLSPHLERYLFKIGYEPVEYFYGNFNKKIK